MTEKFRIVFQKRDELVARDPHLEADAPMGEFEEIEELRRLAEVLAEPEPKSYTTT